MSLKDELAIKYTEAWLQESPLNHEKVNDNTFQITDNAVGIEQYKIDVQIARDQVDCASAMFPPFKGPARAEAELTKFALRHDLSMFDDGSIGKRINYGVDEHTPRKFFGSLGEIAKVQENVGPQLYEFAANNNIKER